VKKTRRFLYRRISKFLLIVLLFLSSGYLAASTPGRDIRVEIQNDYQKLVKFFDPDHPGRGRLDYSNYPIGDNPKSYAMFLSAELMHANTFNSHLSLISARKAGQWLLDNSDLDGDKQIG
jgi:hypothetical protein